MSGAISASTLAMMGMAAAGGMAVASMMAPKAPKANIPTPEAPPAAKQPAATADRNSAVTANATAALPGGAMAGNSGTFLTGAGGIDPSSLNLGKNTLLGQ